MTTAPTQPPEFVVDRFKVYGAASTRMIRAHEHQIGQLVARRDRMLYQATRGGVGVSVLALMNDLSTRTIKDSVARHRTLVDGDSIERARTDRGDATRRALGLASRAVTISSTIRWHTDEIERLSAERRKWWAGAIEFGATIELLATAAEIDQAVVRSAVKRAREEA